MNAQKKPRTKAWIIRTIVVTSGLSMPFLFCALWLGLAVLAVNAGVIPNIFSLGWLAVIMIYVAVAIGAFYSIGFIKYNAELSHPKECAAPAIVIFAILQLVCVVILDQMMVGVTTDTSSNLLRGILSSIVQTAIFGVIIWYGFENWEKEIELERQQKVNEPLS